MKVKTAIIGAVGAAGLFGIVIASAAPSSKKGPSAPGALKGVDADNARHAASA